MQDTVQLKNRDAILSDGDFSRLSRLIYEESGIKMPPTKKHMVEARLNKRLRSLGLNSFGAYCDYLFSSEGLKHELNEMIDLITTNKTDFFREPGHFDYMLQYVLPEWMRRSGNGTGRKLTVWSAGCASGEEPYTLAMVLQQFTDAAPGFAYQILATDISSRVLQKALQAVYEFEKVTPVPQPLQKKYLLRSKDKSRGVVRVVPELRNKVRFRQLNFMDTDFGIREPMDIIFCRNVIIYFDRPTQERLLQKFWKYLAPDGYIFMGHSETLNGLDVPFVQVYPTVYKKKKT